MIGYLTYLDFSIFSTLRYLQAASTKYSENSVIEKFIYLKKYFEEMQSEPKI